MANTPPAYEQEERRARKLRQVRGLLAKADGTTNEHEADVFRAKADELMAAYAISEFDVKQSKPQERSEPISRPVDIDWYWDHKQGQNALWPMMQDLAHHCRCELIYWKPSTNARTGNSELPVVGMPADLDYFDMLFTHLMAQMAKGLEPKPQAGKSMIENLVRMKEAGMKWERIGELLYAAGQLDEPYTRNMGVKFTKLYTDYCDQHNRPRLRVSPSVYQRSFAEGFREGVRGKLREQRMVQEGEGARPGTPGAETSQALVLRDIRQVVKDKARELFGSPGRGGYGRQDNRKRDQSASAQGVAAGRRANTTGATGRDSLANRKELPR